MSSAVGNVRSILFPIFQVDISGFPFKMSWIVIEPLLIYSSIFFLNVFDYSQERYYVGRGLFEGTSDYLRFVFEACIN